MIEKYLKFYISKMNKNDIKNYCIKNNITIDDDELEIVYTYIKENWYEMCFNGFTFNFVNNSSNSIFHHHYYFIFEVAKCKAFHHVMFVKNF